MEHRSNTDYWGSVVKEAVRLILEDVDGLVDGVLDDDLMAPFETKMTREEIKAFVRWNIENGTLAIMARIAPKMASRQLTELKAAERGDG